MICRTRQLICSSDGLVHIVMKRKTKEYFRIVAILLFYTVYPHKPLPSTCFVPTFRVKIYEACLISIMTRQTRCVQDSRFGQQSACSARRRRSSPERQPLWALAWLNALLKNLIAGTTSACFRAHLKDKQMQAARYRGADKSLARPEKEQATATKL